MTVYIKQVSYLYRYRIFVVNFLNSIELTWPIESYMNIVEEDWANVQSCSHYSKGDGKDQEDVLLQVEYESNKQY